jgi:transposase
MGKRKNRKYNNDFKLRAVKLCLETNKPDAEIARDLGVQKTTLSTWKQKYLKNQIQAFLCNNSSDSFFKEVKALKKELFIAKQERDILKKALAICNSQPEKYMP